MACPEAPPGACTASHYVHISTDAMVELHEDLEIERRYYTMLARRSRRDFSDLAFVFTTGMAHLRATVDPTSICRCFLSNPRRAMVLTVRDSPSEFTGKSIDDVRREIEENAQRVLAELTPHLKAAQRSSGLPFGPVWL